MLMSNCTGKDEVFMFVCKVFLFGHLKCLFRKNKQVTLSMIKHLLIFTSKVTITLIYDKFSI